MNDKQLRKIIRNELDKLNIPQHIYGYEYLISSIVFLIETKGKQTDASEVYYKVAEIYQSSYSKVEKAIRNARTYIKDKEIKEYSNKRLIYHLYYKTLEILEK